MPVQHRLGKQDRRDQISAEREKDRYADRAAGKYVVPVVGDNDDKYGKRAQAVEKLYAVAATPGRGGGSSWTAAPTNSPGSEDVTFFIRAP